MWQYFMSILVVPRVLIIQGKLCYFWIRFSKIPKEISLNWQDFQHRIASIQFILKFLGSKWFSLPYIYFVFCLNYKESLANLICNCFCSRLYLYLYLWSQQKSMEGNMKVWWWRLPPSLLNLLFCPPSHGQITSL